jgi:hypothetical protein
VRLLPVLQGILSLVSLLLRMLWHVSLKAGRRDILSLVSLLLRLPAFTACLLSPVVLAPPPACFLLSAFTSSPCSPVCFHQYSCLLSPVCLGLQTYSRSKAYWSSCLLSPVCLGLQTYSRSKAYWSSCLCFHQYASCLLSPVCLGLHSLF